MKRILRGLSYFVSGAVFWLPSMFIRILRDRLTGELVDILFLLVLPVILTLWIFFKIAKLQERVSSRGAIAFGMLLGMWGLGPICTTLAESFRGGGFSQAGIWPVTTKGFVLFLPLTVKLSLYDLVALTSVSLVFLWIGLSSLIRRRR